MLHDVTFFCTRKQMRTLDQAEIPFTMASELVVRWRLSDGNGSRQSGRLANRIHFNVDP